MAHISPKQRLWKYAGPCRSIPVIAAIAYFLTVYFAPSLDGTDKLTTTALTIQTGIVTSLAIIWFVAMRGALQLKTYAQTIRSSADGQGIDAIANSLLVLVLYVIAVPLLGSVTLLLYETSWFSLAAIINNFLPILLMAICISLLFIGSQQLRQIVPSDPWTPGRVRMVALIFVTIGSLFILYFCLIVPNISTYSAIPLFLLPVPLLAITYAVPQLIIWLTGCIACWNIAHYTAHTPGRIYKVAFMRLNNGLLTVIGCIFATQLLIISPKTLTGLTLGTLFTYILLLVAMYGFASIARGAAELQKIEEVD